MSSASNQALIESFCAFIEFQDDHFRGWCIDPRLRRSMDRQLEQSAETSEKFWALYWYGRWQKQTGGIERSHLIAHLQEPCYWASHKAARYLSQSQYSVSDCFQLLLTQIDRIFLGFNPERGASLRGYANIALPRLIRDILRQRQDAHLCSNWSLLRRVSKRQLSKALQQTGLSEAVMAEYRLAWVCYKACYEPAASAKGKALQPLTDEEWQAIAQVYNRERLHQLVAPSDNMTARSLEQRLTQTAAWVRALLYPPMASLNASKPGQEGIEWQDTLSDSDHESLVGELISQEEQEQLGQQQAALTQVLEQAIAALPLDHRQLLLAYYQDQLPQREIAATLNIKQYTVSRRLTRIRESLLKTLRQWSQETLHISLSPDQLLKLSTTLEDWLDQYYRSDACSLSRDSRSNSEGAA